MISPIEVLCILNGFPISLLVWLVYRDLAYTQTTERFSYNELLKRNEWKDFRTQILNRDGHKCRYCGSKHKIQVHHKYYLQRLNNIKLYPWEYPMDAVVTLCDTCHKKVHNNKQIEVYYKLC